MSVTSYREAGARGYRATLAKYGKRRMDSWRRKGAKTGGRKRELTYDEITAGTGRTNVRSQRGKGGPPIE